MKRWRVENEGEYVAFAVSAGVRLVVVAAVNICCGRRCRRRSSDNEKPQRTITYRRRVDGQRACENNRLGTQIIKSYCNIYSICLTG